MEHKTTEALLRGRLLREADESLLQFTAVNAHSILYWSLDRYCKKAAVSEEACNTFFSAFGTDSDQQLGERIDPGRCAVDQILQQAEALLANGQNGRKENGQKAQQIMYGLRCLADAGQTAGGKTEDDPSAVEGIDHI